MGVPPVIIHFRWGFSLTDTIQLLGSPHEAMAASQGRFGDPSVVAHLLLGGPGALAFEKKVSLALRSQDVSRFSSS